MTQFVKHGFEYGGGGLCLHCGHVVDNPLHRNAAPTPQGGQSARGVTPVEVEAQSCLFYLSTIEEGDHKEALAKWMKDFAEAFCASRCQQLQKDLEVERTVRQNQMRLKSEYRSLMNDYSRQVTVLSERVSELEQAWNLEPTIEAWSEDLSDALSERDEYREDRNCYAAGYNEGQIEVTKRAVELLKRIKQALTPSGAEKTTQSEQAEEEKG